jgi:hypothetical protein
MNKNVETSNETQTPKLGISDVSGSDINYKQLYHELYDNVAKMLVENRQHNWHPQVLLMKWDNFRK